MCRRRLAQERERVATDDPRTRAELLRGRAQCLDELRVLLDEPRLGRSSRQRLEAQNTRSREQIETTRAEKRVAQPVENGLADTVRRRADGRVFRNRDATPSPLAGDDSDAALHMPRARLYHVGHTSRTLPTQDFHRMAAAPDEQQGSSFFGKLKARLNRGTNWLSTELLGLASQPLDEQTVEELETRLLTADVGVEATTWLVDGMRAANKRNPGTPAVELLRQTELGLLKTVEAPLAVTAASKPFVILTVGVNGTGKTTTVGKLAQRLKAKRHSVLLAAADTFRAAAVEQLQEWGERAQVPVVAQAPGA